MNLVKNFFFILFLILFSTQSSLANKIYYIDVDYIVKNSNKGLEIINNLEMINKKNNDELKKEKQTLLNIEQNIKQKKSENFFSLFLFMVNSFYCFTRYTFRWSTLLSILVLSRTTRVTFLVGPLFFKPTFKRKAFLSFSYRHQMLREIACFHYVQAC